jgi:hypothetical protein
MRQVKQALKQRLHRVGKAQRLGVQVSMEQGGGPSAALGGFSQGPLSYPMPAEHQEVGF